MAADRRRAPQRCVARRRVLLALSAMLVLCTTSCWSSDELENLAIINAAGIDFEPESGLIALTVHVIRPEVVGQPEAGERAYVQVRAVGRTLFEASRNAIQQLPMRLFWAHNRVIVLGEDAARAGIAPLLDFIERDPQTRVSTLVIVAKGMTANEALKAEYELEQLPGDGIYRQIAAAAERLSTTVRTELIDLLMNVTSEGSQAMVTRMERFPEATPDDPTDELVREQISYTPMIGGAAVFVDDRLVGWLEPLETRGLLWVTGEVRGSLMVVPDPWNEGLRIGLKIDRSTSRIGFAEAAPGRLSANVKVKAHAFIGDVQAPVDPLRMSDFEALVEAAFAAEIEAEVRTALERCQGELRSDVFGFGTTLKRQSAALWRQYGGEWEAAFPELEVRLDIQTKILRSGPDLGCLTSQPR